MDSKLPTDNLYKFLTVSGLVLVCFGMFYPRYVLEKHHDEYSRKLDGTNEGIRKMQLLMQKDPNTGKPNNETEITFVSQSAFNDGQNLTQWNLQKEEIRKGMSPVTNFAFWLGVLFSLSGISTWYLWHQRFQDLLLVEQLEEQRRKNPSYAASIKTKSK